jgi:hypothetical protein
MKRGVILLPVFYLIACSTNQTTTAPEYVHPTKSAADLKHDEIDCQIKMRQLSVAQDGSADWAFMQRCLEGEGWTRKP